MLIRTTFREPTAGSARYTERALLKYWMLADVGVENAQMNAAYILEHGESTLVTLSEPLHAQ